MFLHKYQIVNDNQGLKYICKFVMDLKEDDEDEIEESRVHL